MRCSPSTTHGFSRSLGHPDLGGFYGLLSNVATFRQPVLRVLQQIAADESHVGFGAGKDSDHSAPAADLAKHPLQDIRGGNLALVELWECVELQRVFQAFSQNPSGIGETRAVLRDEDPCGA